MTHYRKKKDEKTGAFSKSPVHDWSSHGASAFKELAVMADEVSLEQQYTAPKVIRTIKRGIAA